MDLECTRYAIIAILYARVPGILHHCQKPWCSYGASQNAGLSFEKCSSQTPRKQLHRPFRENRRQIVYRAREPYVRSREPGDTTGLVQCGAQDDRLLGGIPRKYLPTRGSSVELCATAGCPHPMLWESNSQENRSQSICSLLLYTERERHRPSLCCKTYVLVACSKSSTRRSSYENQKQNTSRLHASRNQ